MLASSPRGVRVVSVPDGSPAAKAGLTAGDVLLAIDGQPVAGLSGKQIHQLLTGEVGSSVRLRIERGAEQRELSVARAPYGK